VPRTADSSCNSSIYQAWPGFMQRPGRLGLVTNSNQQLPVCCVLYAVCIVCVERASHQYLRHLVSVSVYLVALSLIYGRILSAYLRSAQCCCALYCNMCALYHRLYAQHAAQQQLGELLSAVCCLLCGCGCGWFCVGFCLLPSDKPVCCV
jgi:hypothetical protein